MEKVVGLVKLSIGPNLLEILTEEQLVIRRHSINEK